jgi:hypothetical protein
MVRLINRKMTYIVKHVFSKEITTNRAAELYAISQKRAQQKNIWTREKFQNLTQKEAKKTSLTSEDRKVIDGIERDRWIKALV